MSNILGPDIKLKCVSATAKIDSSVISPSKSVRNLESVSKTNSSSSEKLPRQKSVHLEILPILSLVRNLNQTSQA